MKAPSLGSVGRTAYAICAAALGIVAALAVLSCLHFEEAASPSPSPLAASEAYDNGGFPEVDWDYWEDANPDVIGWVSVPGTRIDSPIVRAGAQGRTYYLSHDAYGGYNPIGCPYLDADCEEGLLGSANSVVFGHHWSGDLAFADFARFSELAYAQAHDRVLLQTPSWKRVLRVVCVSVVKGSDATKRTSFEGERDFSRWFAERLEESCVELLEVSPSSLYERGIVTFCTCSYGIWADNERTLVYAAPV